MHAKRCQGPRSSICVGTNRVEPAELLPGRDDALVCRAHSPRRKESSERGREDLSRWRARASEAEAEALFKSFHHALTDVVEPDDVPLGKLSVLMGVKDYPVRVKCATLAWHTFEAALKRVQGDISTE